VCKICITFTLKISDSNASHVNRHITVGGPSAGQRSVKHGTGDSDDKLADEEPVFDIYWKSHIEIITEQPASISNRKLQYEVAPDLPLVTYVI